MEQVINLEQLRSVRDGSGHSVFGPSGSSMWLACPGSLIPNLLADDNSGPDAAYGTVAHGIAEQWLKSGKRPDHLIGGNEFVESGDWGHLVWIDAEMLDYLQQYVDWVEWLPGKHYVERRVDFSRITPIPRQSGTADFIAVDGDTMYVVDLKMGKGVRVYAENNTQGMLYALGALWEFDPERKVKKVVIRIAQPRLGHMDEWEVSVEDLLIFAGWAKARMELAWQPGAPRIAGAKQCQFCKVERSCAAKAKMMVELSEGVFENLDHPVTSEEMSQFKERLDVESFDIGFMDVDTLSTAQLATLKPYDKMGEAWWKRLSTALLHRALDGDDLTAHGLKVVEGRANRKFVNELRAAEHLEFLGLDPPEIYEQKLTTPAKAETALKAKGFKGKEIPSLLSDFVVKPPGKPTIVPLSDKREALVEISGSSFDDLDATEEEEI